jgi:hypothetical protein
VLGAVGAYGYIENSTLRSKVDSLRETLSTLENYVSSLENNTYRLQSEVSTLEDQIDALQNTIANKDSIKTFNFYWERSIAEYFNVTTFWMNITLQKVTTNQIWTPTGKNATKVFLIVELNDLRDNWQTSYLGVVSELTDFWKYSPDGLKRRCYLGNYSDGQRFMEICPLLIPEISDHEFYHGEYGVKYVVPSGGFIEMAIELGLSNMVHMHVEYRHTVMVEFCCEAW